MRLPQPVPTVAGVPEWILAPLRGNGSANFP